MGITKKQREENAERAERGACVLDFYRSSYNGITFAEGDDDQTAIGDMLADLRHLAHSRRRDAKSERIDFDRAVSLSETHFNCELDGVV